MVMIFVIVMRIKLKNSAAYELWILPGDETGRRATQDEIQNHWFHQERMYKRYKYRVLDLYRVGANRDTILS